MKNLLLTFLLAGTTNLVAQVTYVNFFDAVYPYPIGSASGHYNIDLNNDQQDDVKLNLQYSTNSASCAGATSTGSVAVSFSGIQKQQYELPRYN